MGCGRSTLGSDSPKKSKRNEADSEYESDGDSTSSGGGSGRKQQLNNKLVPFGAGGPLLAQAKVSESQHDFFMMLDEKIENGPDYDSETEEVERRRRLQEYAEQWMAMTHSRGLSSPSTNNTVRHLDDDTCGSGDITEEDEDDEGHSEPGRIPDEAVREQYMFMGNLYTLTHIRTDADKTEPKVDVVTVPKHRPSDETNAEDVELGHKLNGSAVADESENAENGVADGEAVDGRPPSRPSSKPSSRPASLILRSVFPTDSVQE
ncbi:uncharacterized protein [Panulirus ornatus]|uniref:uncharacterized protein n=1 Tax=Panulirus ornatus TaxID=150431 RepID=UPI003A8A0C19